MDIVKFRLSIINISGWNNYVSIVGKLNKFVAISDYVQVCCINYIGSWTNSWSLYNACRDIEYWRDFSLVVGTVWTVLKETNQPIINFIGEIRYWQIYQCPLLHHYSVFKMPRLDSSKASAREITWRQLFETYIGCRSGIVSHINCVYWCIRCT